MGKAFRIPGPLANIFWLATIGMVGELLETNTDCVPGPVKMYHDDFGVLAAAVALCAECGVN